MHNNFSKYPKYKIYRKSVWWGRAFLSRRTDIRTCCRSNPVPETGLWAEKMVLC